jgi:hypothetical protein
MTQFLLNDFDESKVPYLVLSYFTEAGDNFSPSHTLVDTLDKIFKFKKSSDNWKVPESWKVLYGRQATADFSEMF